MKIQKTQNKFEIITGLSEELKLKLQQKYKLDSLDIEDIFTYTQLAKIEIKKSYLYIALHFPEFDKKLERFLSKEVHCIITAKKVLIIDKDNFSFIPDFETSYKDNLNDWSTYDIFYEFLDFIITRLFKVIGKFRGEIWDIESKLFATDTSEDLLLQILIIKRNLINYISIISPLYKAITELETKHSQTLTENGLLKIDDSLDKIEKILNNLANYRDQITLLKETEQSLIARSTNETVKKLTGINLLIFVPTLVTSFFGMNVYFGNLSTQENFVSIIAILCIMLILTTAVYLVFRKQQWI